MRFTEITRTKFYKPFVAIALGLLAFWVNFHPLDFIIPPYKASLVLGLVFPMLVSVSWGWRYGLLSLVVGLGGQTMWFLWLPRNGWAPFVSIILYNLWILWHGWCAKTQKEGLLSTFYGAEIPFRICSTIIHYTIFPWVFRFNPSPWAPQMTLTAAPMEFVHFVVFKLLFEGVMILLIADVLLNLRMVQKLFLREIDKKLRTGHIVSGAVLLGLVFWGIAGLADYFFYNDTVRFLASNPHPSLAETMALNVPPHALITRITFILTCLMAGLLIARYLLKYKENAIALRRSETRYREIFNAPNDAIFIHDSQTGKILDINDTAVEMYGYSRTEAIQLDIENLSVGEPPFTQEVAIQHVRAALEQGPQVFEWYARKKDGTPFWCEISLKHVMIEDSSHVIAVVRDIEARKRDQEIHARLEAELRQAHKMEAIGTLAGGIAHDFNNILTAVIGYAELTREIIQKHKLSEEEINQVIKSALRASELVKQILTFSRKSVQELLPITPAPVIKESLKLLRATLPTSIEIHQDIDNDVGLVLADPTKIQQIIVNLCTNALQAMHYDKGILAVSLHKTVLTDRDVGGEWPISPGPYLGGCPRIENLLQSRMNWPNFPLIFV